MWVLRVLGLAYALLQTLQNKSYGFGKLCYWNGAVKMLYYASLVLLLI